MSTHTDPISQIKKAEKDAQKSIEEKRKELEGKWQKIQKKFNEERETFENSLREEGIKILEGAKREAGDIFKVRMEEAETKKTQLLSSAQEKLPKAIEIAINRFENHIKTA